MSGILDVGQVPTSSMILVDDPKSAAEWPVGRLRLTICADCAFIQNDLFDPALIDYTMPYEESQASSPTFRRFMATLIERLGSEFHLEEATLLEVGCGKGEWLAEACSRLRCNGIGIDPAFVPGRIDEPEDIEFVADFFDRDMAEQLTADLVATRHTLEHISDVRRFTELLKRPVRASTDGGLFVEVPDTRRILREGAFWDVYYEHCSYFTAESLELLLSRTGWSDPDVRLGYGDQYLLATARAERSETTPRIDVGPVLEEAASFAARAAAAVEFWRELLSDEAEAGRTTAVWGAGSKAVGFLSAVGIPIDVAVDINPFKQGHYLPGSGTEVIGPHDLPSFDVDMVIAMNPMYRSEISEMIASLDLSPRLLSLGDRVTVAERKYT